MKPVKSIQLENQIASGTARFNNYPVHALSFTQPWAWLLVNGYMKDDNRTRLWNSIINTHILIHASAKCRKGDYDNCIAFLEARKVINARVPEHEDLKLGGFVAVAYVRFAGNIDRYRFNDIEPDKLFRGPFGYRMECRPINFIPSSGTTGLWIPSLTSTQWSYIADVASKA